jgi:regulator of sigma E protease
MSDILIAILAIILVLGVAINIHEFGHFMVAKLFGMRVEAYSFFGLGPRVFGVKLGNTDYRVSAIPLGAYVKLYGDEETAVLEGGGSKADLDEWMTERNIGDGEKAEPVRPEELYQLRPRWQKFLVMLGGPFMNIVLALAIPFGIALALGVPTNPDPIVGIIKQDGAADKAGIKVGDRIVNFDGIQNPSWDRIQDDALLNPEKELPLAVERDGQRLELRFTPTKFTENGQSAGLLDMDADNGVEQVVVGTIESDMPAAGDGVRVGDRIKSVNDKPIHNTQEMKSIVVEGKDQPIKLAIDRNGHEVTIVTHAAQKNDQWRIGIGFDTSLLDHRDPVGIGGAAKWAAESNLRVLRLTGSALGQVSTGQRAARDTLSGPIGIGQIIVQTVLSGGWLGLLPVLMMISLSLGVMNLLPIPLLDGGQILVLAIEKVMSWSGRTLSMVARERIQLTGLAIVLLLMVTVIFFDVSRLVGK